MSARELELAESFLRDIARGSKRHKERVIARAPWPDIRNAALNHPDAATRRCLLSYLDHYDNDSSMATFAAALHDPDEHVRTAALHSLACDSCKEGDLCVADVVRSLIEVLLQDPVADLRIRSLQQLMYLASRDERVRPAMKKSAKNDPDPVVRRAAEAGLEGHFVLPAKRFDRHRVRHAGTRPRARG